MSPGSIKMKFCESLDRFVEIRQFTDEEAEKIFKNVKITDKKSYKRLVINTTIVNYLDEIAQLVFGNNNYSLFGEIAEQELYNLCIKVNPSLDIKKVTITVDDEAKGGSESQIQLLNKIESSSDGSWDISERLINMEKYLHKRIVGQERAVAIVSQAIRKSHVGLRNPNRPVGSFIFAGQTGVGKTELAKALAEFLYGNENELIRIDCSEYSMSHEYAKLIGAPPGYIGHKEGGFLTEAVKNKPKSVILFDELEKAHKKVHNLLLQIMDDGILTDNKGVKVSFKDCVIIMTSNVGVEEFKNIEVAIGFNQTSKDLSHNTKEKETRKALEKEFAPEFLNRVDEIVTFTALTKEDSLKIVDIMLNEVIERLRKNLKMTIEFPQKVREFLVEKGFNQKYGARPLKRAIKAYVENPLAEMIIEKKFKTNDSITSKVAVLTQKEIKERHLKVLSEDGKTSKEIKEEMEKFEKKLKEAEEKIAKADKKKPEPEKEKAIKFTLKPGSAKAKKTNEEKDGDKASLKETADDHEENDK
ncbi:MAG TPA: AAA family ATPase [Candidatus Wallbacteria bacterium]|nr:AAA family ATPase [Candidatus Wallbacteria bacterium]